MADFDGFLQYIEMNSELSHAASSKQLFKSQSREQKLFFQLPASLADDETDENKHRGEKQISPFYFELRHYSIAEIFNFHFLFYYWNSSQP